MTKMKKEILDKYYKEILIGIIKHNGECKAYYKTISFCYTSCIINCTSMLLTHEERFDEAFKILNKYYTKEELIWELL